MAQGNKGHNNPPFAVIELDEEMAEFIVENCDANQRLGLTLLSSATTRDGAEKLVKMLENFKKLKGLVEKAKAK